jgi:hypothetical protein
MINPDMHNLQRSNQQKPQSKRVPLLPLWGKTGLGSYGAEEGTNRKEESRQKSIRAAKPLLPAGQMPKLP